MNATGKYHYEYLVEGEVYDRETCRVSTWSILCHDYTTAQEMLHEPYSALENARCRRKRVYEGPAR